jgi:carboxymethylenebutenolidase
MCLTDDCDKDRRDFLKGSIAMAVTGLAAFDSTLGQQTTQAETRVLDDPRIQHGPVVFKHNGRDTIDGFLARPKAEGKFPAVVVIAGNRITEEYIPNTCAALAVAGFIGLAPNIFHPLTPEVRTREEMQKTLANHTDLDVLEDIEAGIDHLRAQPFVKAGGFGAVGFCFGGRIAMLLGARSRVIDAVVPFHPGPVTADEISRLAAAVQVHSGTADRAVSVDQIRNLEKMLKGKSSPVEINLYEGADHGFLAYTRPSYKPDAAKLAWARTVEFLRKHLK